MPIAEQTFGRIDAPCIPQHALARSEGREEALRAAEIMIGDVQHARVGGFRRHTRKMFHFFQQMHDEDVSESDLRRRWTEPKWVKAMDYVQRSLSDAAPRR